MSPIRESGSEETGIGEAGHVVFEAIVALAVLVLVVMAFQGGIRTGSAAIRMSDLEIAALAVAKGEMEKLGVEYALDEGRRVGRTPDGFDWVIEQRPRQQGRHRAGIIPYWVVVTVTWNDRTVADRSSLSLTSLKLKRGPR